MRNATMRRFYRGGRPPREGGRSSSYVLPRTGQWRHGHPFRPDHTSHAGNVGAAARAMKVMGFDDLVLVQPRWADVLTREETIERASGAPTCWQGARIVATLDEALEGITHVCATAMTPRDFGPPTFAPREHLAGVAAKAPMSPSCSARSASACATRTCTAAMRR